MNAIVETKQEVKSILDVGSGGEAIDEGFYILRGQGQSFVAETDVGLVVVDAGPGGTISQGMIDALRGLTDAPVHALCYSHGHIGYNSGVPVWQAHNAQRGEAPPRLIAHRNLPKRYARYRQTQPLQHRMAEVQFGRPIGYFEGSLPMHEPTETFDEQLVIGRGAQAIQLRWAPSETDDAIALWSPQRRVLYGGASLLDSIPNIGTPLRTMRDTVRWAHTLQTLASLEPRIAVREFGLPIVGAGEVQRVLLHTARALLWVRDEVVRLMNEGLNERDILARVRFPEELFGVPWMNPKYGDPSYIVRDVYRSENGWWDRNPTSLHPAAPDDAGRAVADAITDKAAVLAHAQRLADGGEVQLALHAVDLLATACGDAPELKQARMLKASLLRQRAEQVTSFVSRNLYRSSADLIEQGHPQRFGIR